MKRAHALGRWQAFEALEERRHQLCRDAVWPYHRRELWQALALCPPAVASRYNRLCRIASLYRTAAVLGD